MAGLDSDLKVVLKIRKMRVDSLRRIQKKREMERIQAAQDVEARQSNLEDTETQVRAVETERLNSLINGQFVKIDRIEAFSKLQLKGIKQIMDANREIELAQKHFEHSTNVLEESVKAARAGEKKLMAVEEAIRETLWK